MYEQTFTLKSYLSLTNKGFFQNLFPFYAIFFVTSPIETPPPKAGFTLSYLQARLTNFPTKGKSR